MKIARDLPTLRAAAALGPFALVPTMGNLHRGHVSLVRLARGHAHAVAVSVFVNRLQFAPGEDFERYPRTFEDDRRLLDAEGVELVFAPPENVLYPQAQTVMVHPGPLGEELEGRFRPGFFNGVSTVVLKLFNAVRPLRPYSARRITSSSRWCARWCASSTFRSKSLPARRCERPTGSP